MLVRQLDEIYPQNYYSFTQLRHNVVTRVKEWLDVVSFRRICSGIPGDYLAALDVGGGTGWLLDKVKAADPRFKTSWVADIDPGAQAIAEKAGHRYALGPFEQFIPEISFDLILMLNLIEHVADPAGILQMPQLFLRRMVEFLSRRQTLMPLMRASFATIRGQGSIRRGISCCLMSAVSGAYVRPRGSPWSSFTIRRGLHFGARRY
jgi:Methyltransferase domain